MFDVPFLINNPYLVPPVLLGSNPSILLTNYPGETITSLCKVAFMLVRHCMLDKVSRRAVNIAVGIDDLGMC